MNIVEGILFSIAATAFLYTLSLLPSYIISMFDEDLFKFQTKRIVIAMAVTFIFGIPAFLLMLR